MNFDEYRFGYFHAGSGRARWRRMTIRERLALRKRRRKADDLACLKGRWGL